MWARTVENFSVPADSKGVFDLLADYSLAAGAMPVGVTVARTHLKIQVQGTNAGDGLFASLAHVGIIVTTGENTAAEAPDPREEPYADWLHWEAVFPHPTPASIPAATAPTVVGRLQIDNKAKRRLDEIGERLWLSVHNDFPVGSTAISASVSASVLLLLP